MLPTRNDGIPGYGFQKSLKSVDSHKDIMPNPGEALAVVVPEVVAVEEAPGALAAVAELAPGAMYTYLAGQAIAITVEEVYEHWPGIKQWIRDESHLMATWGIEQIKSHLHATFERWRASNDSRMFHGTFKPSKQRKLNARDVAAQQLQLKQAIERNNANFRRHKVTKRRLNKIAEAIYRTYRSALAQKNINGSMSSFHDTVKVVKLPDISVPKEYTKKKGLSAEGEMIVGNWYNVVVESKAKESSTAGQTNMFFFDPPIDTGAQTDESAKLNHINGWTSMNSVANLQLMLYDYTNSHGNSWTDCDYDTSAPYKVKMMRDDNALIGLKNQRIEWQLYNANSTKCVKVTWYMLCSKAPYIQHHKAAVGDNPWPNELLSGFQENIQNNSTTALPWAVSAANNKLDVPHGYLYGDNAMLKENFKIIKKIDMIINPDQEVNWNVTLGKTQVHSLNHKGNSVAYRDGATTEYFRQTMKAGEIRFLFHIEGQMQTSSMDSSAADLHVTARTRFDYQIISRVKDSFTTNQEATAPP